MTCNILGALLRSFCRNCSTGNICDFSNHNTIIIGNIDPAHEIHNLLENQDLEAATRAHQIHQQSQIQIEQIDLPTEAEVEGNRKKFRAAIFDVAMRCLADLSPLQGIVYEEGWSRLTAASHLARIDLKLKYREGSPLTKEEHQRLLEKVKQVGNFGSLAVCLWSQIKRENIQNEQDFNRLKRIASVSSAQIELLKRAFRSFGIQALLDKETFGEISPEIQAVFVEAARKPQTIHGADSEYVRWTKEEPACSSAAKITEEEFKSKDS